MNNDTNSEPLDPSRTNVYSIISIVLALPLPILITILWITLDGIKQEANLMSSQAMNAIILYAVQFFIIPLCSAGSIIIAIKVLMSRFEIASRLAIASLSITAAGCVLLALFLQYN